MAMDENRWKAFRRWANAKPDEARQADMKTLVKRFGPITKDDLARIFGFIKRKFETPPEAYFSQLPRKELGGLLKEYLAESGHGGWDGFEKNDLVGIRKLLRDMMFYHQNTSDAEKRSLANDIDNVNPVP